jgi:hypothetical protein
VSNVGCLLRREPKHEEAVISLPPGSSAARAPPEDLSPAIDGLGEELGELPGEKHLLLHTTIVIVGRNSIENIIQ